MTQTILYIRGLVFFVLFSLVTLVTTICLLFAMLLPFKIRTKIALAWSRTNLFFLKWLCGVDHEVQGLENVPRDQSVIVLGNHQSTWETIACQLFFSPVVWVLKRELMWIPVFGWGIATLRPIAIKRGQGRQAVTQLLDQGTKRLNQFRCCVVVFPEGTRVAVGVTSKYKLGGALLAESSGVSVVPFAHNAGYYWSRRRLGKTPGKIKVIIGKPIVTTNKTSLEILAEAEAWIRNAQQELGGKV